MSCYTIILLFIHIAITNCSNKLMVVIYVVKNDQLNNKSGSYSIIFRVYTVCLQCVIHHIVYSYTKKSHYCIGLTSVATK